MSDAIVLDVADTTPVRLDVGDADPIAREEIAELATRVTTVEGDVTALDGRLDTAEGNISTLGTTVDGIDERVEAIEADYVTSEDVMGALGGEAPALVSGSSRAMLGDTETASWMERTTAADGAALIESVQGNTLRLNQLFKSAAATATLNGVTFTNNSDGSWTANGTATANTYYVFGASGIQVFVGHKYIAKGCPSGGSQSTYQFWDGNGKFVDYGSGAIFTAATSINMNISILVHNGCVCSNVKFIPQIFDLTAMFGAGNEPATVAEFEALFPEPYYPYDSGSLLPVRMEGVETVAADESWSSTLTIPASTYFPQGMRSAGTVCDELRADAAVTRVGERAYQSGDESDASVITDGTVTHYALTTPTTTPIDPPLPMSYRTGNGGTERVMVASGTTSAPPIFATRYPLDPADLAASIAPVDGPIAKTNHQVGDLIMLGFTLCKATQVIVTGETIAIGTNVTRTTVAAELAALSE